MAQNPLNAILQKIPQSRVVIVGDVMLDRFVNGAVERISPESPVPVLSVKNEEKMLGGAGNTLANLAGLRTNAKLIAVIGDDDDGADVKNLIEKLGLDAGGCITDTARPTISKTRFLAGHQQLLRTDYEYKDQVGDATAKAIVEAAKAEIKNTDILILSDYGKGTLRKDVIQELIIEAAAQNIPVLVDPKGSDFSIYKGANAITPNKKELHEAVDLPVDSDEDVIKAAQKIISDCGIEAVIATRSGDGISIIQKQGQPVHLRGADIEVFDVSGAGDTVIASIGAAVAAGANLPDAAALANVAGSIVVTKVGTAPIRFEDLENVLNSDQGDVMTKIADTSDKGDRSRKGDILDLADAKEQVERWKARGLKVGFTNGCFDILHYGHVSYLNNARDHCDRLIVAMNHDASVRILKGPERPINDEVSRAHVLAALGSVDMVVQFGATKEGGDNTAITVIESLKPDIYFKGGDYTEDQVPEAPTVKANGGEVNIMPVYEGHSTTNTIRKSQAS